MSLIEELLVTVASGGYIEVPYSTFIIKCANSHKTNFIKK